MRYGDSHLGRRPWGCIRCKGVHQEGQGCHIAFVCGLVWDQGVTLGLVSYVTSISPLWGPSFFILWHMSRLRKENQVHQG